MCFKSQNKNNLTFTSFLAKCSFVLSNDPGISQKKKCKKKVFPKSFWNLFGLCVWVKKPFIFTVKELHEAELKTEHPFYF